jgi:recombinational DNA repair protein RecT
VYCKTTLPDGSRRYTVMYLKDIKIIQAKSRAKNGPWSSDFVPMALKSVVKMDFKTLGVPPGDTYKALRVALAADTAAETGEVDSELKDMEEGAKPSAKDRFRETLLKRADESPPSEPLLVERTSTESLEPSPEEQAEILRQEHEAAKQ